MKKPVILLLILAALVGVAVFQKNQQDARLSENVRRGVKTRDLLLPDLNVNAIHNVQIQDQSGEVNLVQEAGAWTVKERAGYPADFEKLSRTLIELRETKISGKQMVGKAAWADEDLLEPAEGVTEGTGTLVKMIDEKGGEVASMVVGGEVATSGSNSTQQFGQPQPRFVRIPWDDDSIWMVGASFYDLKPKVEDWLDKKFIQVEQIKALEVTHGETTESWKVERKSQDETAFNLAGAKADELLDDSKLTLSSLLATPTFNDVRAKEEAAEIMTGAVKARITTFEDFTYDIQVKKESKDGADKYFMTVSTQAKLPEKRAAAEDEKEEDKERLDKEFESRQTAIKEKLAKEQALEGWVFEVAEYTVNNLLLKRTDITKKPEEPAPAEPATTDPVGSAPAPTQPIDAAPSAPPPAVMQQTPPAPAPETAPEAPAEPSTLNLPPAAPPMPKVEMKPSDTEPPSATTPPVELTPEPKGKAKAAKKEASEPTPASKPEDKPKSEVKTDASETPKAKAKPTTEPKVEPKSETEDAASEIPEAPKAAKPESVPENS